MQKHLIPQITQTLGYFIQTQLFLENTTLPDDLSKFKKGEAASHNFFNLIDIGNAGIDAAAKNGNIKKIHYVDTKVGKVYIPLFFIPIYVKETKTVVYGE